MKELGKYLNIKQRTSPQSEKERFCELIELYESLVLRSDKLIEAYSLNLTDYEDNFYFFIENLFDLHYGDWKTEIISWYIWDRKNPETGEIGMLEWTDDNTDTTKEILIECAEDLWNILKQIEAK
tara:strand:- start:1581 stop:1955 length:375 start_codon:yes stop_codon:yes gene_type:complete